MNTGCCGRVRGGGEAEVSGYARLLRLEQGPIFPNDYRAVNTEVISFPGGVFTHSVTIAAGSSSGVRRTPRS